MVPRERGGETFCTKHGRRRSECLAEMTSRAISSFRAELTICERVSPHVLQTPGLHTVSPQLNQLRNQKKSATLRSFVAPVALMFVCLSVSLCVSKAVTLVSQP